MPMVRRANRLCRVSAALFFISPAIAKAGDQWLQWGGPHRDFKVDAKIIDKWEGDSPKVLWSRELGDGYSCILADGENLYTQYHVEDEAANVHDDVVVALKPESGQTVWEYRYPAPFTDKMLHDFGYGPRSTPLVVGHRLFTVGATAILTCLDKKNGQKLWSTDLIKEHGAGTLQRGYGASPFAYKDMIILPIGKPGPLDGAKPGDATDHHSVIAFNQSDGKVVWKNQDFGNTYASPFLYKFDGKDQLIIFGDAAIYGLNPENGEKLWSHEHAGGANISTPVAGDDGIFFFSSAYGVGSRAIQLKKDGDGYTTEELFFNKKMKIHHGNAIRIGDYVYASSGDFGPAFFAAVNVKTGKFGWKKRGISKANCVLADDKLIILDEDGKLYLATVTPKKIKILCEAQLLTKQAWSVPTLVGDKLYIRDLKKIMAVDLGAKS